MTDLGDSGRFHVDGDGVGIEAEASADVVGTGDKDVARGNQSVTGAGNRVEGRGREGCFEEGRAPGGLTVCGAGSAPHVVVGDAVADDDVEDIGALTGSACNPGVDDERDMEVLDQSQGCHRRIDFADSRFEDDDLAVVECAGVKDGVVDGCAACVREKRKEQVELLVHGHYNTDFHFFSSRVWLQVESPMDSVGRG